MNKTQPSGVRPHAYVSPHIKSMMSSPRDSEPWRARLVLDVLKPVAVDLFVGVLTAYARRR